ncbi:MAG: DUF58 domain-containing protein [Planctomycetes bacterium]|nr:DUF58 domain-containing protein [Planctomycetota bacterium]MCW8135135.1 DUF58 domain-containing protein [Planctomycetota bacterium]
MPEPLFDEAAMARIRNLRLNAQRVQRGGARGERLSRQFGAGQEFGAHRQYVQGDDLRRVDWNVYGRLDQLFVKLFELPGQLRVLLVADDAPTMDFGAHSKWLAARRALAAVGLVALHGAERVLACRLSDSKAEVFDGTGESRLLDYFGALATRGAGAVAAPARSLFETRGRDSVLVLASDFQQREPALQLLSDARRAGARAIAVCVHAAEELNPRLDGFTRLQPVAAHDLKLRVDERVLAAYKEELAHWREGTRRAVHGLGAALIELDSADPIEPLIVDLVRAGVVKA